MGSKTLNTPRRGLNRTEAACYVGIGVTKFNELVAAKTMPLPRMIGTRLVWDIVQLDAAFDELPSDAAPVIDSWADFHNRES
jgi:predicted DNA-binding transcriptional regulator AlpA